MAGIHVVAVVDPLCAWCFIGKRALDEAVRRVAAANPGVAVEVSYRPFLQFPELPRGAAEAVSMEAFMVARYGPERYETLTGFMKERLAEIGVAHNECPVRSSSVDALRLLSWCHARHGPEVQARLLDRLFVDAFARARHLGEDRVLRAAAEAVGLEDAGEVVDEGHSAVFEEEMMREYQWAAERVQTIPSFIIGEAMLSGAQSVENLVGFLGEALEPGGAIEIHE